MSSLQTLKKQLEKLRAGEYSAMTAEIIARDIRTAVQDDTTSWEELETTDAELTKLVGQEKVKELKKQLEKLRSGEYSAMTAESIARDIRTAVQDDTTSREELETTDAELTKLVGQAKTTV